MTGENINPSDEALCREAAEGGSGAEEQLVRRYGALVRSCVRPYFLAGGDSEDLLQEGMLGLLSAVRQYDPANGASFRIFAELCVRRRLYSAIKSAAGVKHAPLNDCVSLESSLSDEPRAQDRERSDVFKREPEDAIIDRERADELLAAFSSCLSRFEAEILGSYLKGLSCREIAVALERQPKSVDNAVQRIRRKLVRYLERGDISAS